MSSSTTNTMGWVAVMTEKALAIAPFGRGRLASAPSLLIWGLLSWGLVIWDLLIRASKFLLSSNEIATLESASVYMDGRSFLVLLNTACYPAACSHTFLGALTMLLSDLKSLGVIPVN